MASEIEFLSSAYETSQIPFKNTNGKDILHSVLQVANKYISDEHFLEPKIPKTWTHIQPTLYMKGEVNFWENEIIIKEIINDIINGLLKHSDTNVIINNNTNKYYDNYNNELNYFNSENMFISPSMGMCNIHANYRPPSSLGNGDFMYSIIDTNEILTQIIEYATLENHQEHDEAIILDDIQCSDVVPLGKEETNRTIIENDLNKEIEKKPASSGAWSQFKKMFFQFNCIRPANK